MQSSATALLDPGLRRGTTRDTPSPLLSQAVWVSTITSSKMRDSRFRGNDDTSKFRARIIAVSSVELLGSTYEKYA